MPSRFIRILIAVSSVIAFTAWYFLMNRGIDRSEAASNKFAANSASATFGRVNGATPPANPAPKASPGVVSNDVKRPTSMTFDRSTDLYLLATQASHSTDPTLHVHGFMAASSCMAAKEDRDRYNAFRLRAQSTQQDVEKARSIELILDRCRGFLNNDDVANRALRKQITDSIRAGTDYVAGVSLGSISVPQFKSVLERQDNITFEKVFVDVIGPMLETHKVLQGSSEGIALGAGYLLAQCDLGRDCGANSLTYAQICASEGNCPGSLQSLYTSGMSSALRESAEAYRRQIVGAFQARDVAFFGMRP